MIVILSTFSTGALSAGGRGFPPSPCRWGTRRSTPVESLSGAPQHAPQYGIETLPVRCPSAVALHAVRLAWSGDEWRQGRREVVLPKRAMVG